MAATLTAIHGEKSPVANRATNAASEEPGNKVADKKAEMKRPKSRPLINERPRAGLHQLPAIVSAFARATH